MSMAVFVSRWTLLFFLFTLFSASSTCSPVYPDRRRHKPRDYPSLQQRDDGGIFSVLGIAGLGDNTIYPRLEIRELEKNTDQWNVYLLGLQRFQSIDQNDKLSWFQIAGIHGRPWIAWDDVDRDPMGVLTGFCTHSSNLFPTWHRPYLALYEEILYLNARQVISEFPEGALKDRYYKALSTFRMPYWDWAAVPPTGEGTFPWSMQRITIDVAMPNGTKTIPNPLYSYTFHPIPDWEYEGDARWKKWPSTMRDPTTDDEHAQSQNNIVALNLDGNRRNMQSRIYNLLALEHDYNRMSNKLQPGDSLETIHGTIHDMVGANAHMTWLQYSAFDPSFWLHHTNVDRILAIWQEVNHNSWVTPWSNPDPTFAIPAGTSADSQYPLEPFHKDDAGNFWNSDDIRNWQRFGYTYPELLNLNASSTIINRVNSLYGPNATPLQQRHLVQRGLAVGGAPTFAGKRQYTIGIKVREFAFEGSIKVYVFLKEPTHNETRKWVDEQGYVGVTSILAAAMMGTSEANAVVPLTAALEAKVHTRELQSMEEGCVKEYLTQKLKWKVVKANGELIGCEKIPGFRLFVNWQEIEPAKSPNEFPSPKGDVKELLCTTAENAGSFA